ncbi:MAG: biopolymer transporter ExbD [Deltaproteobacteria bacterium]|nr:MAG: biopolymer transporter ExbD [Deltaproteobacteria bacterium]TMQ16642.1 MAG: biopolymer transporter ExbD [Deltaproteobacteria bacterium]
MAQALGTSDKKSVNVDLNIIPFIDLMSCITAFLMVTAVWINIAQLEIRPAGHARDAPPCVEIDCDPPKLSVLIEADDIWVGVSRVNDFQKLPKIQTGYDWTGLETALRAHKASAFFERVSNIEIAADSTAAHPIAYQELIAAMDTAVKAGFIDVGITDPQGLSARPVL